MDAIGFLAAPICLGVLLVGIHAYLGLHVLEREVLFVDISLSQVAALGSALSFFVQNDESSALSWVFSLGLCLLVAFGLALLKRHDRSVSQEAIVGMTYALASGAMILVADKLPHGGEHLKEALIGNILFVAWPEVIETLVVYLVIGSLHWIFRASFWKASRGEQVSYWWDFLFYFLFGIVITFSTKHAGVLVVFSILVAPAAFAKRSFKTPLTQLMAAWIMGVVGVLLSFALSYRFDLPSGAAIVCTLPVIFFLGFFWKQKRLLST